MAADGLAHPRTEDLEVGAILLALADDNRRRVVRELAERPDEERLCASFELPVSKSSRTRHWRVLREAGLVRQRDAGNGLYMRLRKADLDRRFPGLIQAVTAADQDPPDQDPRDAGPSPSLPLT
ncbi:ArsR/SmtB family transcription factor [Streptomyces sp. NPDC004286]|uniref:ArsR/SmtB family transcription factor n=1 Tax=Streptomyces sp. NPDC004286 TaxID=3364696 RepID=UPI0036A04C0A